MRTLTANEAKTNFGNLLLNVQKSPVQINRNGKPVAVMLSYDDYETIEQFKLQMLRDRANQALIEISSNDLTDGEQFFAEMLAGKFDE